MLNPQVPPLLLSGFFPSFSLLLKLKIKLTLSGITEICEGLFHRENMSIMLHSKSIKFIYLFILYFIFYILSDLFIDFLHLYHGVLQQKSQR